MLAMATPEDHLAAYFDTSQPRGSFDDEQIETIALLLARCSHAPETLAERSPRTYIICRMIGRCDLLPRLLSEGFGDDWFPVSKAGLPGYLDPRTKTSIYKTQPIILTKSLNLENGRHCNFDSVEQHPFEIQSYIGSGSFGQVRVVESRVTYKQYALKTVRRRTAFGTKSKEIMSIFKAEMKIMKSLQHKHVGRYIGSYTDRNDLGLLISPVADCDLGTYLEKACKTPDHHPTLRTFFGCLATALSYLHDEGIKHRDIKPKNVLVHKANVLLADFGISHDFLDTTTGPTAATQRYCSPEVASYENRNTSADVWSLGCVFLEIQSALQTKDLNWITAYYKAQGTGSTHYHANSEATLSFLNELRSTTVNELHARPLVWIEHMLAMDRRARPTAAEVTNYITSSDSLVSFRHSCIECCFPSSQPGSVGYLKRVAITAHQHSYNQQVIDTATLASEFSQISHDPSSRQSSERQTRMIAKDTKSPEKILPSISKAATPAISVPVSRKGTAFTNTGPRREVGLMQGKDRHHIKRAHDDKEDLDVSFTSVVDNPDPGTNRTAIAMESVPQDGLASRKTLYPNEIVDATNWSETIPSARGKIAVSRTEPIPQRVDASSQKLDRLGTDDLYRDQDGFSKSEHTFDLSSGKVSWDACVPNIVVFCTKKILKRSMYQLECFSFVVLIRGKRPCTYSVALHRNVSAILPTLCRKIISII
jgi:serine/threonine protein kinase